MVTQNPTVDKTQTQLQAAALWYAAHGYHVLPLIPGDKKTLRGSNGVDDATTDAAQIARWWAENPRYNIGIAAGPSGLLILDPDTYKTGVKAADLVAPDDLDTVTTLTPNGGQHIWYKQPQGGALGNATGDLPKGVDVRGHGGYVVAPPSILYPHLWPDARGAYRFVPGHSPRDLTPRPLPAHIQKRLANQRKAEAVTFGDLPGRLDLGRWRLAADVVNLIHEPPPKGARSEADYRVILALIDAGASDDEIRAVFVGYPIGAAGKYAERGRGGDRYLAHSIGKARAHQKEGAALVGKLRTARIWIHSAAGVEYLKTCGIRRPEKYLQTIGAVLDIALVRRAPRVLPGLRPLGEAAGVSYVTARRHLERLAELRPGGAALWNLTIDRRGLLIDLTPLLQLFDTVTVDTRGEGFPTVTVSKSCAVADFYTENRAGDAWRSGIYAHAVKRRKLAPLAQSLGSGALLVWPILADAGDALTVYELADASGLSSGAARRAVKRLESAGLLLVWHGKPYRYELHPDAENRLEQRTPHMLTHGMGALHAYRHANSRAAWTYKALHLPIRRELREVERLKLRLSRADGAAGNLADELDAIGLDPKVKVMPPRFVRTLHYDPASEWENHKVIWETWIDLSPAPRPERLRMLAYAGYTRQEIDDALRMAQRAGKAKREFIMPETELPTRDARVMEANSD